MDQPIVTNPRAAAADIDAQAQRWTVRAPLTESDAAALAAWLDADSRHRGAYVRAQAAWQMLDRGRALAGNGDALEAVAGPNRRRWIAAAAIGVVLAAGSWAGFAWRDGNPAPPLRFASVDGEVREFVLADGSRAVLNADSAIEVAFADARRSVRLVRGEAWFEVAHDRARPFLVTAGSARAEAVGTAFSVRHDASGTAIVVTEGVVRVASDRVAPALVRKHGRATFDSEGSTLAVRADGEGDRALAWRFGQLAFDGETLGAAAAQFNRYNARKIAVADRKLADERVSGLFDMREPDRFAQAASTMFDAQVEHAGRDRIVIRRAKR